MSLPVRRDPAAVLRAARVAVARSLVSLNQARSAYHGELGGELHPEPKRKELRKAYEKAQRGYEALLEELASDPIVRAEMTPWMIDFHGSGGPHHEAMPLTGPALRRAVQADVSEFARKIRAWLDSQNANITDSGSGMGGWDLGALCDDAEAARICREAQIDLREYLDAGVLTIHLRFWGWRLRGVSDLESAEAVLRGELS